ncbi:uncharacterized protein L203_103972 [Cryptococcus depauperatus CBS 7841]|uniref:Uncharacterized protein n=1 Tax=Cryptococcus depauperatus CBS 7841 TaxID=1295531 RepID=A0AAJ8JUX4_9TREE
MEYYIATPETKSPEARDKSPKSENQFSLSPLSLGGPVQPIDISSNYFSYPPSALTYQQQQSPTASHPSFFHPYRSPVTGEFSRSPKSPKSPALSSSPHGSIASNRLSFSAATAVSPALVSPHSIAGSVDASPNQNYPYTYPFYGSPLSGGVSTLGNVSPNGPGLSMVAGFPYPTGTVPQSPAKSQGVMRSLRSRGKGAKKTKRDDASSDEEEDEESPKDSLGLTGRGDDRLPVSNKREDVRRARIESEQRRRDELREVYSTDLFCISKLLKAQTGTFWRNLRNSKESVRNYEKFCTAGVVDNFYGIFCLYLSCGIAWLFA